MKELMQAGQVAQLWSGSARLLKEDGNIEKGWKARLDVKASIFYIFYEKELPIYVRHGSSTTRFSRRRDFLSQGC